MATQDIISRLVTHLNGATSNNRGMPDVGTRNMGGSFRNNAPYISGYFHAIFDLPNPLFSGAEAISTQWLNSTCESFTPPSETINYTEISALGQVKSRHYTGRTVTNDITLAFREYQNLPIMNIIGMWVNKTSPL